MAPVYQEIELVWNGVSYKVTPTYKMIQAIEQKLSLASILQRVMDDKPPFTQLAELLAMCLKFAGCTDAPAEDIHDLMWEISDGSGTELQKVAGSVLMALLPSRVKAHQGNPTAPEAGAKKNSQTSTGGTTTKSPSDKSESSPPNSGT